MKKTITDDYVFGDNIKDFFLCQFLKSFNQAVDNYFGDNIKDPTSETVTDRKEIAEAI